MTEYKYDSFGNLIESTSYDSDGDMISQCVAEYDSEGNKTQEIMYGPSHRLIKWVKMDYDDSGNLLKVTECNVDGSTRLQREYVYL